VSVALIKPRLYVVFREHDPRPPVPWLPRGYPSTCTEINGTNKPPLWPHEIMDEAEVKSIQASLRTEFLIACHLNGAAAKEIRQVELAMALPTTKLSQLAWWVDEHGRPVLERYNAWMHRVHSKKFLLDPRFMPLADFGRLREKVSEMNDLIRRAGQRVGGIRALLRRKYN
jgi:hypothetical protein